MLMIESLEVVIKSKSSPELCNMRLSDMDDEKVFISYHSW